MFENRSSMYRQQDPLPAGYGQSQFNPHQNEMAFTQNPNNPTTQSVRKPVYSPHPPPEQDYAVSQPKAQPTREYAPQIVQSTTPIKKVSYLIDWIVCILPIIFFIIILILMICLQSLKVHHLNPEGAHATLEKLQKNLLAPPILDIIELPPAAAAPHTLRDHYLHKNEQVTEGDCPAGYGRASLGNWEGVNSGCLCDDGEVKSKAYCTLHFASDKCKSVKTQELIYLSHWKERQYCLKHSETWKWVAGVDCPTGQKKCGGNICIPTEHTCPLSELRLMTTTPTAGDSTVRFGTQDFIKVHEVRAPLVDLEIIPGGPDTADCFNSDIGPLFPSKKFYPLSKKPQQGCDKYKNLQSYTIGLDSESVKEVQKQNKIQDKLKEIPFYEKYIDPTDTYELEIISRIEIKNLKECGSIHPDQVLDITTKSQRVYNFEANLSIVILIICLVILVLAPILYILRKKIFTSISMPEHHQPKLYAFVAIIVVALCLILGFIYLTDVDGNGGLKENNSKFAEYKKHECFVDQGLALAVNEVNSFALNSYETTQNWIISAFYISIAFLILLILLLVYQYSVHGEMFANPWKDRSANQFKYEQYN